MQMAGRLQTSQMQQGWPRLPQPTHCVPSQTKTWLLQLTPWQHGCPEAPHWQVPPEQARLFAQVMLAQQSRAGPPQVAHIEL